METAPGHAASSEQQAASNKQQADDASQRRQRPVRGAPGVLDAASRSDGGTENKGKGCCSEDEK
jgi:hypothetical protein